MLADYRLSWAENNRQAGLANLTGVPGIPVYDVTTRTTSSSVNDAVNEAKHDSDQINKYGKTWPLVPTWQM